MTPDQKAKLLSLIRAYGEAEVKWSKEQQRFLFTGKNAPYLHLVKEAYTEVVNFVHKL